jgi:hypothetical protein
MHGLCLHIRNIMIHDDTRYSFETADRKCKFIQMSEPLEFSLLYYYDRYCYYCIWLYLAQASFEKSS